MAVLDIRESGEFGLGHLLLAAHLPYSTLETGIHDLVPRSTTLVVLIDADDTGLAVRAADRLRSLGYSRVDVLSGGMREWERAGFPLFQGTNVPTKAFAEMVLEHFGTPEISARELQDWIIAGRSFVLVDGRTAPEHRIRCIPGSTSVPNGELILHIKDLVSGPSDPIIVHCAGRTRSIIGAQTLIAAGIPNPVFALRGGTQEWSLNSLALEHGNTCSFPELSDDARMSAARMAEAMTQSTPDVFVNASLFDRWRADPDRTLYLFDVRTQEEYEDGHLPGAVHAAAGQLVHAIDNWCGTRGGRIALLDTPPFARASMAAYWLKRQGWDAVIPTFFTLSDFSQKGTRRAAFIPKPAPRISIEELAAEILAPDRDPQTRIRRMLIDAGTSSNYRRHHLPNAQWLIRPRVLDAIARGCIETAGRITLYGDSDSDPRADLMAQDIKDAAPGLDVSVLSGGRDAWLTAGYPVQSTPDTPSDAECIDHLFWLHDRHTGNLASARAYLDWELSLVESIGKDGSLSFAWRPS